MSSQPTIPDSFAVPVDDGAGNIRLPEARRASPPPLPVNGTPAAPLADSPPPPAGPTSPRPKTRGRLSRGMPAVNPITGTAEPQAPQPAPPDNRPWKERFADWVTSRASTSYATSFVVHGVLLASLALMVLAEHHNDPIVAIEADMGGGGKGGDDGIGEMLEADLSLPEESVTSLPVFTSEPVAVDTLPITAALMNRGGEGAGSGGGDGGGEGTGQGSAIGEGILQLAPKNAVRAGSFTAWTTPYFNAQYPRPFGVELPEPGDAPRPGQPYEITIQIKVPGTRKAYPTRDLTGMVIGTDKYEQRLPENSYYRTRKGDLQPIARRTTLPVIDGFVQIVVKVPGAVRLTRDVITVESKMLKEERTLQLEFTETRETQPES